MCTDLGVLQLLHAMMPSPVGNDSGFCDPVSSTIPSPFGIDVIGFLGTVSDTSSVCTAAHSHTLLRRSDEAKKILGSIGSSCSPVYFGSSTGEVGAATFVHIALW